jgi:glycolate oxidase FAD binding subunit
MGALEELIAACGAEQVRPAGPGDAVADTPARWVVSPGRAADLVEVLHIAAARRLAVVPRGSGSKLDWGRPPFAVDVIIDTGRLAGVRRRVREHEVVVGAGTPLRAVRAELARHGTRLALDPASADATIGGVIAADEAGPLRHTDGAPRRQVVSLRYAAADGTLTAVTPTRAGVPGSPPTAGAALFGSFGTVGVVTSATLRVQAVPPTRTWVVRGVASPLEVYELVESVRQTPLAPAAVEVDLPVAADPPPVPRQRRRSGHRIGTLAMLFEGGEEAVTRAEAATGLLGGDAVTAPGAPDWWGRYPFGPGDVALRVDAPIDMHSGFYTLRDAAGVPVPVRGSAGVGVLYAALPGDMEAARVAGVLRAVSHTQLPRGGGCTLLRAPASIRRELDGWGPSVDEASLRRVKGHFDPLGILSPGRLPREVP